MKPSNEQIACVDFAVNDTRNLLINALAGAAKSTTLGRIARALPDTSGIVLAFNKRIADEMNQKLPDNFRAQTLNAIGHGAWRDAIGRRLILNKRKNYEALSDFINGLASKKEKDEAWDSSTFVLKSAGHAKSAGHVPDSLCDKHKNTRLINDEELFDMLEEKPTRLEKQMLLHVLTTSIEKAFLGEIDFDDQLLMPTVFRASFQRFPLVLVDEAQDLSELNHAMLKKIVKRRIIAVGDQCQAIYAFRGAHSNGMEEMRRVFDMETLNLSCSFRCPQAVVEHVQWRAPHMVAWSGNPVKGEVNFKTEWSFDDIPDHAAIICRNNAPLFRLALVAFRKNRYPKLWGNDIVAGMKKIMRKLGADNMPQSDALDSLSLWFDDVLKKARNTKTQRDRYECMRMFLESASTLGKALEKLDKLMLSDGRINLMTAHKSKGWEFDDVFILDEDLIGDDGQEPNLRYVAATRSKNRLTYIASVNCLDIEEEIE